MDTGARDKTKKKQKKIAKVEKFLKKCGGKNKPSSEDEKVRIKQMKELIQNRRNEFTNTRQTRLLIGTWNCAASKNFEESLDDWLPIPNDENAPDIVAVGFQETVKLNAKHVTLSNQKAKKQSKYWIDRVLSHLNHDDTSNDGPSSYVYLDDEYLVGVLLIIFVKSELQPHTGCVSADTVGVGGPTDTLGNKGGVSIRFQLYESTLCFICSHLEALQEEVKERNRDFKKIIKKIEFDIGKEAVSELNSRRTDAEGFVGSSSSSSSTSQVNISDHDVIFWFGDLNYRVDESIPCEQVIELCEANEFDALIAKDQLTIERAAGRAFSVFQEGPLTFRPTYKYEPGTDTYSPKRTPGWCDRILWQTHPRKTDIPDRVTLLDYKRSEINVSDHKPVMANFLLKIEEALPEQRDKVSKEVLASVKP